MKSPFDAIPSIVIEYVRHVFKLANDKVTTAISMHPSMHEESLDHILIMELTAAPAAFFSTEQVGVSLESHWLGGRWMYRRWEIADIAFFVLIRHRGTLTTRKVALLQTKRLYSKEIPVGTLEESEYMIGIGRLVDRTDPTVPLSTPRAFSFGRVSTYSATSAGNQQIERINAYVKESGIPVYYGLYNPLVLPFQTEYPATAGNVPECSNEIGCRILPADHVHGVIMKLEHGQSPSVNELESYKYFDPADPVSKLGWRLERFIADELLRCRQGHLFQNLTDPNLQRLLYGRSAPIAAAIMITIDIGRDS